MDTNDVNNVKRKRLSLIVTIVLGVLILFAAGYILYFDFIRADEKSFEPQTEAEPTLSVKERIALLELVPIMDNSIDYEGAYGSKEKDITNIEPILILNTAYNYVKNNNLNKEKNSYEVTTECPTGMNCISISRDDFKMALDRLYGPNINIEYKDFQIGNLETDTCSLQGTVDNVSSEWESYLCKETIEKPANNIKKISRAVSTKEDGSFIYVYEDAVFAVGYNVIENNNVYNITIDKIYHFNVANEAIVKENYNVTSNLDFYSEEFANKLFDDITEPNKTTYSTFRHKFAKGTNGYYWVSTEPAKVNE